MGDLKSKYENMTYNQLINVRENGVLNKEAYAVLCQVIQDKEAAGINENEDDIREAEELAKRAEKAILTKDFSELNTYEINKLAADIILTTETASSDLKISKRLEVISAECVYGMNIFRDFFASVRDVIGGRSGSMQKVLRDARKTSLTELKREALMLGADAVVGVKLDYSEIGGGGKAQMLMIVSSGTAVKLEK